MTSYLLPHEQESAKTMVQSLMACPLPKPLGSFIAVKMFVDETHIQKIGDRELIVPPSAVCSDLTRPHPALVIGKGTDVKEPYTVGDFIVIPRHEGAELCWYGHAVRFLEGHKTYSILERPEDMTLLDAEEKGKAYVSVQ